MIAQKKILKTVLFMTMLGAFWHAPVEALETLPPADAMLEVSQADGQFQVIYRCEYLDEDETTLSGVVVVAVENRSGQAVRELTARIPDFSPTSYGHFPIIIGEVADGQMKEVIAPFTSFKSELSESPQQRTVWQLEFIDPSNHPVTLAVDGEIGI